MLVRFEQMNNWSQRGAYTLEVSWILTTVVNTFEHMRLIAEQETGILAMISFHLGTAFMV